MDALRATFDLLYERKRMLTKDLDSINSSIRALQTKCDHIYEGKDDLSKSLTCQICGLAQNPNITS